MVYNVAAIQCLQFVIHAILFAVINGGYFYVSTSLHLLLLLLLSSSSFLLFTAPTHVS